MNALGKLFLKGLVVVIPVTLTLAILWWMARGAEEILGGMLGLDEQQMEALKLAEVIAS